jgi:hypothetical protein
MSSETKCASCGKGTNRNKFRIFNGGDHYTERFCTQICVEKHLEQKWPGWVVVGMKSVIPKKKRQQRTHLVMVKYSTELKLYDDKVDDRKPVAKR